MCVLFVDPEQMFPFFNFQEKIYEVIEKEVKNTCKIVQKRMKGNSLRFQLLPIRDSSSQGASNTDSNQNDNDKGPL